MNLLDKLRSFLGFPKLRNKAGGMAWIRRYGEAYGADVLAGQIVKTEHFEEGFWNITPQPVYTVTAWARHSGRISAPGEVVQVIGLPDDYLEPIPDAGVTDSEVDKLYAPTPQLIPLKVLGEVSAE